MKSMGKNIKAETISAFALDPTNATAGGTGDATEVTGRTIDLTALATRPNSVVFEIAAKAVLADTKSLVVTGLIEDSANGSSWATLVSSATLLTLTSSGGTTERGVGRMGVDLSKARRYIRCKATPDLSASGTDTATIAGVAVFGGLNVI